MRILVTGATGRIGSRLVPRLLQRSDTIRVLARKAEQVENLRQRGVEVAVGDLLQPDTLLRAVADADVVVHLAAFFRGATEAQARAVNTDGTLALTRVGQQAGVSRFIYISTNLVYGHGYGRPAREDDEPHPEPGNIYPVTKLAAERALQDSNRVQKSGLCILRLAFVYGEGDPHLAEAVRWARTWHPEKRFHMVHHADVAQAVMLAIARSEADGKLYNVADEEPVTASEILRLNGMAVTEEARKIALDDPWEGIVDTARIQKELGFRPIYPSVCTAKEAQAL